MKTLGFKGKKQMYKETQKQLSRGDSDLKPDGFLIKIQHILSSHTFHYIIIGLVIFDVLLVMSDLGLWLTHSEFHADHDTEHALHILKLISLVILCIFEVEFVICILAFGFQWLCQPGHLIDVVVVTCSLIFDIIEHNEEHFEIAEIVALMVVARLWRIARIGHAFGETAFFEMELLKEKYEKELNEKDLDIARLKELLNVHQIEDPVVTIANSKMIEMTNVIVEKKDDKVHV